MRHTLRIIMLLLLAAVPVYAVSSDLETAIADHQFQLDIYRKADEQFQLRLTDFEQNNTFANQQLLEASSKKLLEQRDTTWDTYWQALRIQMLEQADMPGNLKNELTDAITTEQSELKEHQLELKTADSLEVLRDASTTINNKDKPYQHLAYRSLAAINIAKNLTAIREVEAFLQQAKKTIMVQIRDTAVRDERLRGIDETMQTLIESKLSLETLLQDDFGPQKTYNKSSFDRLNDEVVTIYQDIQAAYQRSTELSSGIEL